VCPFDPSFGVGTRFQKDLVPDVFGNEVELVEDGALGRVADAQVGIGLFARLADGTPASVARESDTGDGSPPRSPDLNQAVAPCSTSASGEMPRKGPGRVANPRDRLSGSDAPRNRCLWNTGGKAAVHLLTFPRQPEKDPGMKSQRARRLRRTKSRAKGLGRAAAMLCHRGDEAYSPLFRYQSESILSLGIRSSHSSSQ
jgi:hypothetical protein